MRRVWGALSLAAAGLIVQLGATSPRAEESSTDADDRQEEQIRAALQQAPDLANNRIEVDVDDGIAELEGTVDSQREKKRATELAHVDGVLGVNNRLEVRSPPAK
jgi:osmotically-inducible protein OsmY